MFNATGKYWEAHKLILNHLPLNALFGSLAIAILFLSTFKLTNDLPASIFTSLLAGFSNLYWSVAVVTEAHTLNASQEIFCKGVTEGFVKLFEFLRLPWLNYYGIGMAPAFCIAAFRLLVFSYFSEFTSALVF